MGSFAGSKDSSFIRGRVFSYLEGRWESPKMEGMEKNSAENLAHFFILKQNRVVLKLFHLERIYLSYRMIIGAQTHIKRKDVFELCYPKE
jgi:hypothetical protein